jgi:hypothetical protein
MIASDDTIGIMLIRHESSLYMKRYQSRHVALTNAHICVRSGNELHMLISVKGSSIIILKIE